MPSTAVNKCQAPLSLTLRSSTSYVQLITKTKTVFTYLPHLLYLLNAPCCFPGSSRPLLLLIWNPVARPPHGPSSPSLPSLLAAYRRHWDQIKHQDLQSQLFLMQKPVSVQCPWNEATDVMGVHVLAPTGFPALPQCPLISSVRPSSAWGIHLIKALCVLLPHLLSLSWAPSWPFLLPFSLPHFLPISPSEQFRLLKSDPFFRLELKCYLIYEPAFLHLSKQLWCFLLECLQIFL